MNTLNITLEDMLNQREKRAYQINEVKNKYPNKSIISFKLNIPGPNKNNKELLFAFNEGLNLLDYEIIFDERLNNTGPECILISNDSKEITKVKMIEIEDNFSLGRLYDLDVLDIDRSNLDIQARKCLICNDEAHACSRSRKHGLTEVLDKIYKMIDEYKNNDK